MEYTVDGILQTRILEWVAIPFSRKSSQSRDQTQVSHLQADSLPFEPPGKPKNTGVDSQSLLQWNFLTQEWNQDLLQCRQLPYQLSYPGSPYYLLKESESRSVVSDSLQPHGLYSPWNSLGQNPEWVVSPFSSRSPQPRNRTRVSCIGGRFCTNWAIREELKKKNPQYLEHNSSESLE